MCPVVQKKIVDLWFVVVFCFYFCNTKREKGGKGAGPNHVPTQLLRHMSVGICFEKTISGLFQENSLDCQSQCKDLKMKTSHLFVTQGSNKRYKTNLFGKCKHKGKDSKDVLAHRTFQESSWL